MSESTTYRLGFLNGRLKGLEDGEALLELTKGKIAKK